MKLLKSIAVVLLLIPLISPSTFAYPLDDPSSELREVIVQLLRKPGIHNTIEQNVRISFFVTDDEKLVVLKTDARNKALDEFIKERMNYQQIQIQDLEVNRIIHIKVRFIPDDKND